MTPMLRVEHLSKSFGGVKATQDVSFVIEEPTIVAIVGPNGAGKSTLFNLLTNLFHKDSGRMYFENQDISRLGPPAIAKLGIARTFQTARVFQGLSVMENVLVGAHRSVHHGGLAQALTFRSVRQEEQSIRARAQQLVEGLGIAPWADAVASDLPMPVQKRMELARALMMRPKLLLLDEPAAGLNDRETADLAGVIVAIRDAGCGVLLVEHHMPMVMGIASRVIVMDAGEIIAEGTPKQIQENPLVVEAYFGSIKGESRVAGD